MSLSPAHEQTLIEKLRELSPDKVAEVEDFVDFLRQREEYRQLLYASAKFAEPILHEFWDNPENDVYNEL